MNRPRLRSFVEAVFSCAPHGQYGYLEHSTEHASRVAHYQRQLVSQLELHQSDSRDIPSDFFGTDNKQVLEASCWLHDVGNFIGRQVHQWHTYTLLSANIPQLVSWRRDVLERPVGLSRPQLEEVAVVCLAHRKPRSAADLLRAYFVDLKTGATGKSSADEHPRWIDYDMGRRLTDPRLRLDAALLMLADTLDRTRAPCNLDSLLAYYWPVYPESHAFSPGHWEQHRLIGRPHIGYDSNCADYDPPAPAITIDMRVAGPTGQIPIVVSEVKDDCRYVMPFLFDEHGVRLTVRFHYLTGDSERFRYDDIGRFRD